MLDEKESTASRELENFNKKSLKSEPLRKINHFSIEKTIDGLGWKFVVRICLIHVQMFTSIRVSKSTPLTNLFFKSEYVYLIGYFN